MKIVLNDEKRNMIATMLENGANNGRISLKFPGIRKDQINKIRAEINKGTDQTKRKLKRDPLLAIYRSSDIGLSELYAAEHIRYAYSLITADVSMRVMDFSDYVDRLGARPTESESALKSRIQAQYVSWFDECSAKRVKVGPIIHLLTEPVTLRETDAYYGMRRGRSRGYLVDGLKLYVEMFHPRGGIS